MSAKKRDLLRIRAAMECGPSNKNLDWARRWFFWAAARFAGTAESQLFLEAHDVLLAAQEAADKQFDDAAYFARCQAHQYVRESRRYACQILAEAREEVTLILQELDKLKEKGK